MANELEMAIYAANPKRKPWNTPQPSRDISWYRLNCEDTAAVRRQAQAVHDFLGAKNLERNAVATMVAALRLVQRPLEGAATTYPNHQMDIHAALNALNAALRAAGEEVE